MAGGGRGGAVRGAGKFGDSNGNVTYPHLIMNVFLIMLNVVTLLK